MKESGRIARRPCCTIQDASSGSPPPHYYRPRTTHYRPYVLCSRVMSNGGGRFDFRFDFGRGPEEGACFRGTDSGWGEGSADRRLPFREGVCETALVGAWPNVADSELERGGWPVPSGDGLMVDEYGT